MLTFPQLPSGAQAQYPIKKRCVQRTIVNTLIDGRLISLADPGAALSQWEVTYQNLADTEIAILQEFFATCEGQLNAFTFLDPLSNLLAWSEMLNESVWEASSLLQMTANISDPSGGTTATRITNPTASDLTLQQTINGPGWFSYCFSLYASSQSSVSFSLFLQAGTASINTAYVLQSGWARIHISTALNTTPGSLSAGIVIPAGQSVDVFGFQLEPQPVSSIYKRSLSSSGVHANAHLKDDAFAYTTSGPNNNSCSLTIIAR